jgi:AAA15 family ATPase/GTPase
MLIQFTFENYLSFKKQVTFSLLASSMKEHEEENVFTHSNLRMLRSAVVYGANASGKTNLFLALNFMKRFVLNSSKESQSGEEIDVVPFRLSTQTERAPSFFEVIFVAEGTRYRYGFEVDREVVQREWLYFVPNIREAKLFDREGERISIGTYFKEGKGLSDKTRSNALFLSVVAQFNGEISNRILKWFRSLKVISGLQNGYLPFLFEALERDKLKSDILKFAQVADLGIEDLQVVTHQITHDMIKDLPDEIQKMFLSDGNEAVQLRSLRRKFDEENHFHSLVAFDFEETESEGTKKLLSLAAPLLAALKSGSVLLIDELDAKLHPLITRFLIRLFHSSDTNPNNAQLIFSTHDTSLLDKKFFRRDQVWFTEKDRYGCTDLYSLVEYKVQQTKVRHDASFAKDYIQGKYGAIPFIGHFDLIEVHHGDGRSIQEEES